MTCFQFIAFPEIVGDIELLCILVAICCRYALKSEFAVCNRQQLLSHHNYTLARPTQRNVPFYSEVSRARKIFPMPARPIKTSGILHQNESGWFVALGEAYPTFEENAPVDLVLWDKREGSEKSEVELISEIQQIEPEIIALALSAEGALK